MLARMTSLSTGTEAGRLLTMSILRKITVQVPEEDLQSAQAYTGEGVTETVRAGLKTLANIRAQNELRKLRGTFKFTIDLDELREDRDVGGR
jgi:hypothetical protein